MYPLCTYPAPPPPPVLDLNCRFHQAQALAITWVRKAAASYYAPALSALGTMYLTGFGSIDKSAALAYKYFYASAGQGDPYGWYQMAEAHDPRYNIPGALDEIGRRGISKDTARSWMYYNLVYTSRWPNYNIDSMSKNRDTQLVDLGHCDANCLTSGKAYVAQYVAQSNPCLQIGTSTQSNGVASFPARSTSFNFCSRVSFTSAIPT